MSSVTIPLPDGRRTTFEAISFLYDLPSCSIVTEDSSCTLVSPDGTVKLEVVTNPVGPSLTIGCSVPNDDCFFFSIKYDRDRTALGTTLPEVIAFLATLSTAAYLASNKEDDEKIEWLRFVYDGYKKNAETNKHLTYAGAGEPFNEMVLWVKKQIFGFSDPITKTENDLVELINDFRKSVDDDRFLAFLNRINGT
jgi:hypothetical protein